MKNKLEKLMLLLTIVGAVLSFSIFLMDKLSLSGVCPTNGCNIVANSPYSYILGIPVSILGLIYYFGMSSIIFLKPVRIISKYFKQVFALGLGWGIIFSVYLRYVEFFKIHAICFWCWGSVVVILGLTTVFILWVKRYGKEDKEKN